MLLQVVPYACLHKLKKQALSIDFPMSQKYYCALPLLDRRIVYGLQKRQNAIFR